MNSILRTAIEDLRAALADEDAGNGHVRDCAFEVVEAWAAAAGRTPAPEAAGNTPAGLREAGRHGAVTMSHHEIKRGRIICPACLMAVHDDAC